VAKITTIHTFIVNASVSQWQMDVKNDLKCWYVGESMVPPSSVSHNQGGVCKLKKVLYGLKQAPCAWFEKF
jgi:hypothetical protein